MSPDRSQDGGKKPIAHKLINKRNSISNYSDLPSLNGSMKSRNLSVSNVTEQKQIQSILDKESIELNKWEMLLEA